MMKRVRWTVAEVTEFCGWDFLQNMIDLARMTRTKRLIAASFLTGGRNKEDLLLETSHFDFEVDPKVVVVRAMPVVKRYEKVGDMLKWRCVGHCKMRWGNPHRPKEPSPNERERHNIAEYMGWKTLPKLVYRTFPFPKNEPLVPVLQECIKDMDGRLFNFGYDTAYREVVSIGKELGTHIPTHWFRTQRAHQLAFEYGFTEPDLMRFFDWVDYNTAVRYARVGYKNLAAKMVRT